MHHLSDEEFQQVRQDIYQGLQGYLGPFEAYRKLVRGLFRLSIPPDDVPGHFRLIFDLAPVFEGLEKYGETIESIKEAQTPQEILSAMSTLNDLTDEIKRRMDS